MTNSTKLAALITIALGASACASNTRVERPNLVDGNTWVELSSTDSLVPELRENALQAGCTAKETAAADRAPETEILCRGERLFVRQTHQWLGFRCDTLSAKACDRLVQSLSLGGKQNTSLALRSSPWGI